MKLRIKDNSLRLRLTRSEVSALAETGRVEAHMLLSLTDQWDRLAYAIEHAPHYKEIRAERIGFEIRVTIPSREIQDWARGEIVSIYGSQQVYGSQNLSIVVEKDFACMDGSDEDNDDTFENPGVNGC